MRTKILAGVLFAALGLVVVPQIAPAAIGRGGIGGPDSPGSGYEKIYKATLSLNASTIVGSTAGTLGHASGVTAVEAVSGKRIMLREGWCAYDFVTAAYTGGGVISLRYGDTAGNAISTTNTAAGSFLSVADRYWSFAPATVNNPTSGVGASLVLASGAAFTQPGTAAGTAVCTIYYSLVDA
jgi:hypothetical protein